MCRMCRMDILTMTNLSFFFFNDTATTEIYTLSLHDALPIWDAPRLLQRRVTRPRAVGRVPDPHGLRGGDRKSTRLNSSHLVISYAVFCLKKKKTIGTLLLHCWELNNGTHTSTPIVSNLPRGC